MAVGRSLPRVEDRHTEPASKPTRESFRVGMVIARHAPIVDFGGVATLDSLTPTVPKPALPTRRLDREATIPIVPQIVRRTLTSVGFALSSLRTPTRTRGRARDDRGGHRFRATAWLIAALLVLAMLAIPSSVTRSDLAALHTLVERALANATAFVH